MGVNIHHFILLGCEIGYDKYEENNKNDELDKENWIDKKEGVRIICDGMSGKYCFVGIPLYISKDGRYEMADIPKTEIPPILKITEDFIKDYCLEHFGQEFPVSYYVFTHYH